LNPQGIYWDKKSLKPSNADTNLLNGGAIPMKLQLNVISIIGKLWTAAMITGVFLAGAGGAALYITEDKNAIPWISGGLILLIGSFICSRLAGCDYFLDGEKKALCYNLKLPGFKRSGIVRKFADISAVSVNASKYFQKPKTWWEHQVVALSASGWSFSITMEKRDAFQQQTKIAENLSRLIECSFVEAGPNENAVAMKDSNGRHTFIAKPYASFRQYKAHIIFAAVSAVTLLILIKVVVPMMF